jgi:hypothetical protein
VPGDGKRGIVTNLPLYKCSANANCTLAKLEPTKLPWKMHTVYEETKPQKAGTASVEFTGSYSVEAVGPEHAGQTVEAR